MIPDSALQLVSAGLNALDQSVSQINRKASEIRAKTAEGAPYSEIFETTAHLRNLADDLLYGLVGLRESMGEKGLQDSWSEVLKSHSKKVAK